MEVKQDVETKKMVPSLYVLACKNLFQSVKNGAQVDAIIQKDEIKKLVTGVQALFQKKPLKENDVSTKLDVLFEYGEKALLSMKNLEQEGVKVGLLSNEFFAWAQTVYDEEGNEAIQRCVRSGGVFCEDLGEELLGYHPSIKH